MKILYVEDELVANIDRINRLFGKYLDNDTKEKLTSLQPDASGYIASPQEIKLLLDSSGIIDCEYRFPEALERILNNENQYAFYIIDRNLEMHDYTIDELKRIQPKFKDDKKYSHREGDYLIQELGYRDDIYNRLYILTANTDPLRTDGVAAHLEMDRIRKNNFITKSDDTEMQRLIGIIENSSYLDLLYANLVYTDIVKVRLGIGMVNSFLQILQRKDQQEHAIDNIKKIRTINDKILTCIVERFGKPDACYDEHRHISPSNTIYWIKSNQPLTNEITNNFLNSIRKIGNESTHPPEGFEKTYQPTTNTVNALIYALKDIILFMEQIVK